MILYRTPFKLDFKEGWTILVSRARRSLWVELAGREKDIWQLMSTFCNDFAKTLAKVAEMSLLQALLARTKDKTNVCTAGHVIECVTFLEYFENSEC